MSTSRKQKTVGLNQNKSKKAVTRKSAATRNKSGKGKIILSLFLILLSLLVGVLVWFYAKYGKRILALRDDAIVMAWNSSEDDFCSSLASLVYAEDGSLLTVLKSDKEKYYLSYDQIPKNIINAALATEDRKFYQHQGIDYIANFRALKALIEHKGEIKQGASTITQQLARTIYLTNEVTIERKLSEMFLALELEKKYSKAKILEYYFNNIYYANGYYGIQAACNGYFSKGVSELTLSEAAFLSAIPNSPTYLNPLNYYSDTLERRDKILLQMYETQYISKEEYLDAKNEKIVLHPGDTEKHNYAESYTYYCAVRALMEKNGFEFRFHFNQEEEKESYQINYQEEYDATLRKLYSAGYRIYTSIDLKKQELLQDSLDEVLMGFHEVNEEGIYQMQGAAVCIDNDTGRVVAIIGGREQESNGNTLNRAYQSHRQPGSAIKPLIVYTPVFERGHYPDEVVMDEKESDGPRNSGNVYSGEITIQRAVEVSKNTIAWQFLKELTPDVALSYLYQMNYAKLVSQDNNLGISIGGFTYGVSPVELTAGFACLENDGVYRIPTCIVQITDAAGTIVVGDEIKEKKIYEENAAHMMTNVLTGVMKNGTGKKMAFDGITTAGKTGTTTDRKDGWFVGYSKYYTTGVWVGYDYPKSVSGLAGNTYPGIIWKSFMSELHKGLEDSAFPAFVDIRPPKEIDANETNQGNGEAVGNAAENTTGNEAENAVENTTGNAAENITEDDTESITQDAEGNTAEDDTESITQGAEGNATGENNIDYPVAGEAIGDKETSENAKPDEHTEEGELSTDTHGEADHTIDDIDEDLETEIWDERQWQQEQWPESKAPLDN